MKQRFSSLDVKIIAHELNEALVSLRVSNIYDLSSKIFLIKFSKPDNKKQLVIDTGFRCHVTDFARTTAQHPSQFVEKLRKVLKTRRVTSVTQIGSDRVLEFQFSDGQYRLYLEFFASGNIILTDADLKIITLQRHVTEGEGQEQQRPGLLYRLDNRQNYNGVPELTIDRVKSSLETAITKNKSSNKPANKKAKVGDDLRKGLAVSLPELPPMLVEHALAQAKFDVSASLESIVASQELLAKLHAALLSGLDMIAEITQSQVATGYIIAKRQIHTIEPLEAGGEKTTKEVLLYDDFHPFLPHKFADNPAVEIIKIEGFNKTVDDFFSSIEGQKLESRLNEREANAKRKLDAARQDQFKRVEGLQNVALLNMQKAAAIEANIDWVQEAIDAVNGLLDEGMDWVDAEKLIEREQKRGNPVASIIKLPMKLANNTITLLLSEAADEESDEEGYETASSVSDSSDEEENDAPAQNKGKAGDKKDKKGKTPDKRLQVDVKLKFSPWSNAREYYDQKRTATEKQHKTAEQSAIALKNAEEKIKADLKRGLKQEKPTLHQLRVPFWFEKFLWFVSSDGYLVLASKDGTQADMLYRKHLKRGDVWSSADVGGACCVVIKNNATTPDAPIPPSTLGQAGTLAVASSDAWDSKAGMGAWWVKADQVTKKSAAGDFLPIGQFSVKGEKNFLPPPQLLIGFGVMFKVSEASAQANHSKHRVYTRVKREKKEEKQEEKEEEQKEEESNEKEENAEKEEADEEDEEEAQDKKDNPLSSGSAEAAPEEPDVALSEKAQEMSIAGDEPSTAAPSTYAASTTAGPEKKAPLKRGQKAKLKKIAAKYKDQDEEDRAAAEMLLGATAGRQKAEAEARAKAQREAEYEATKARRRAQHAKHQQQAAAHEERRRRQQSDGGDVSDDDEEPDFIDALECLVGTPAPGDEILEAIPVAAPWNAMTRTKYKVKLQPGAVKKGKAVKEILERWKGAAGVKGALDDKAQDTERVWPREAELLKSLKPEEVVNVVPVGKVRVMLSGGMGGGSGGAGGGGGGKGQGKGGKGNGGGGKGKKK